MLFLSFASFYDVVDYCKNLSFVILCFVTPSEDGVNRLVGRWTTKQNDFCTDYISIKQGSNLQIYVYPYDNYPKCDILVRVSVVSLLRRLLGLVTGSASERQPDRSWKSFLACSWAVVVLWGAKGRLQTPLGVVQVRQWGCQAVGPSRWPTRYQTHTRCY